MKNTMNKVLSVVLACIMLLCLLPVTALATQTAQSTVEAWNLVLADEIAVNFRVSIENAAEDAVMRVTDGYGTVDYPVFQAEKTAEGNYLFTGRLAAAQMADQITLQLISGEETGEVHTYTAAQYAEAVLTGEYKQSAKDLVLAMINYGAAAQNYFDYNTEKLANAGYVAEPTAEIPAVSGVATEGSVSGISLYGASLLFQSRVAVRFYFAGSVEGLTFSAGEPAQKNGLYYVDVTGINPQDYDNEVTLTVTDGADTLSVSYSPLAYISRQYAKSSNEALRNLVANMYQYHIAAENYLSDSANGNVTTDGNGIVTEQVILSGEKSSAVVAAGTQLDANTTELTLSVAPMDETDAEVELAENESLISMDVHVEGISKDNTVPVLVTLDELAPEFLNKGNIALYHVEDGVTVEMTRVYSAEELDAHNEYYYDIATGTVTVALASFSEVAVVADNENLWNGNVDTEWYKEDLTEFEIFNADQLAGLGKLVDDGNTFDGKTVTMLADVNLKGYASDLTGYTDGERIIFNPIGYGYAFNGGKVFMGTFDGNGHTISGLYQQGWDLEAKTGEDYTYSMAGGGLFASIVDSNIKNLTMDNADIVMECVDMGIVVGYANGTCNFENIIVRNSTIQNYNRTTGGVIGEVGGGGTYTLNNVDVEATTTVSALWGTFDPPMGGLIGGKWGEAGTRAGNGTEVSVVMKNCDVACKLDAYNDVTSAYQWYSYRRAGMLIGDTEESKTVNGRTEATASWLKTENCTVSYGNWANYTYCQFSDTTSMGAQYPWVRVQEGLSNSSYSNARYGRPTFAAPKEVDWENHTENDHIAGDGHNVHITFRQLYGGGQGCYGGNSHIGEGSVTEIDAPTPVKKFENDRVNYIESEDNIKLGNLFHPAALDKNDPKLQTLDVIAYVSPASENDTVRATFDKSANNWENSSLTFTGSGWATITIQDYYYCEPTTIKVYVCPGHDYNTNGVCKYQDCGHYIHDLYVYNFDNFTITRPMVVEGKSVSGFDLYLFYNHPDWLPLEQSIVIGELHKDNFIMDDAYHTYDFSFEVPSDLGIYTQYVYFDPAWTVLSRQMAQDLKKITNEEEVTVLVTMKTTGDITSEVTFVIDKIRIVEKCTHTDGNQCSDYVQTDEKVLYDYDYTDISGNIGRTAIAESAAYKDKTQKFEDINLTLDNENFSLFLAKIDVIAGDTTEGTETSQVTTVRLADKNKSEFISGNSQYATAEYTVTLKKSDWENINSKSYIFFGVQSLVKNYQMAQDLAKLIEASESEEITVKITISYRFTNDLGDATDCTFYVDRMQIRSVEE